MKILLFYNKIYGIYKFSEYCNYIASKHVTKNIKIKSTIYFKIHMPISRIFS